MYWLNCLRTLATPSYTPLKGFFITYNGDEYEGQSPHEILWKMYLQQQTQIDEALFLKNLKRGFEGEKNYQIFNSKDIESFFQSGTLEGLMDTLAYAQEKGKATSFYNHILSWHNDKPIQKYNLKLRYSCAKALQSLHLLNITGKNSKDAENRKNKQQTLKNLKGKFISANLEAEGTFKNILNYENIISLLKEFSDTQCDIDPKKKQGILNFFLRYTGPNPWPCHSEIDLLDGMLQEAGDGQTVVKLKKEIKTLKAFYDYKEALEAQQGCWGHCSYFGMLFNCLPFTRWFPWNSKSSNIIQKEKAALEQENPSNRSYHNLDKSKLKELTDAMIPSLKNDITDTAYHYSLFDFSSLDTFCSYLITQSFSKEVLEKNNWVCKVDRVRYVIINFIKNLPNGENQSLLYLPNTLGILGDEKEGLGWKVGDGNFINPKDYALEAIEIKTAVDKKPTIETPQPSTPSKKPRRIDSACTGTPSQVQTAFYSNEDPTTPKKQEQGAPESDCAGSPGGRICLAF